MKAINIIFPLPFFPLPLLFSLPSPSFSHLSFFSFLSFIPPFSPSPLLFPPPSPPLPLSLSLPFTSPFFLPLPLFPLPSGM